MPSLKSNHLILCLFFFISACQSTGTFNIKTFASVDQIKEDDLHVIHANSTRVQQQCLFLDADAENNWRHQYFLYVLNDKNEVLEIMQPTHLDKVSCSSQVRKVEKLLRSEPMIKVCARDELKKSTQDPKNQKKLIQFGPLGAHQIAYDALTLDSICNSRKCVSNNEVWVNTCPGFIK